jgi:hypothetical protein
VTPREKLKKFGENFVPVPLRPLRIKLPGIEIICEKYENTNENFFRKNMKCENNVV